MHNIIFGILFLSNLLLSPVIFAEENEEGQLSISSMLKDLRGETNENQDYIPMQIEKDLLAQFSACWMVPAGVVIEDWMTMKVSIEYNQDGTIKHESVTLLETNIAESNPFYKPIVESSLYSMCKKIDLPSEQYDYWEKVIINFDFSNIN